MRSVASRDGATARQMSSRPGYCWARTAATAASRCPASSRTGITTETAGHCSVVDESSATPRQHHPHRLGEDLEVEDRCPVDQVLQVVAELVAGVGGVVTLDLSEA